MADFSNIGNGKPYLTPISIPCLPLGLVKDRLHADSTGLLLTPCHRKAQLHVSLVLLKALGQMPATLVEVGRVEHLKRKVKTGALIVEIIMRVYRLTTVVALLSMNISTTNPISGGEKL